MIPLRVEGVTQAAARCPAAAGEAEGRRERRRRPPWLPRAPPLGGAPGKAEGRHGDPAGSGRRRGELRGPWVTGPSAPRWRGSDLVASEAGPPFHALVAVFRPQRQDSPSLWQGSDLVPSGAGPQLHTPHDRAQGVGAFPVLLQLSAARSRAQGGH